MNFLSNILAEGDKIRTYMGYQFTGNLGWLQDVYATLPAILFSILAVVGGAGAVYAIILGINLAKSESDDKRKTASTRLRNTIIGVAVLLVLVIFINIFLPMILDAAFVEEVKKVSQNALIPILQLSL